MVGEAGTEATSEGATAKPPQPPQLHERKASKNEVDRAAKARGAVAGYLVERDGMDVDLAAAIVAGMEPETIHALIQEAATAVMDKMERGKVAVGGNGNGTSGGQLVPDGAEKVEIVDDVPVPDFLTIPALAESDTFAYCVTECAAAARRKNEAEKEYKDRKSTILATLKYAKVKLVECVGIRLAVYEGSSSKLDETLLLEAGVDPATIRKCWKRTKYTDVRLTVPVDKGTPNG